MREVVTDEDEVQGEEEETEAVGKLRTQRHQARGGEVMEGHGRAWRGKYGEIRGGHSAIKPAAVRSWKVKGMEGHGGADTGKCGKVREHGVIFGDIR